MFLHITTFGWPIGLKLWLIELTPVIIIITLFVLWNIIRFSKTKVK